MGIPAEEIAQVRAATDIVALIGEQVALRKSGLRWTGLCPFHSEKSPSFSVNAEEGLFYCFGCKKSGDAITFVRESTGMAFIDSVRMLADRAGIELHEDDASGDGKERSAYLDAVARAVDFYHDRLLHSPDAAGARSYLRSRGYDGDVVRSFRLGWAPDDWDQLARHLRVPDKVLEGAGLGFVNKRGRAQDFIRNRVVFPICDPGGRPIAMGGRILPLPQGSPPPERHEPKYKNSPETSIYSKRRTLYGLNWAKKQVVEKSEIIVCEGYTDVIAFFQADLPRAVATCGTALAEEHFKVMRNFAKRIVLAYDGDAAGQSATGRVYEWERSNEVDVAVCELPEGVDPAELARHDPDALRAAVSAAKPFLQFRVDRAIDLADLGTAEGRAKAAEAALGAVAEHPDALVRDQYVMGIADRCHLSPDLVRERLANHVARPRVVTERGRGRARGDDVPPPLEEYLSDEIDEGPSQNQGPVDRPGIEALTLCVHRPDLVGSRLEAFLFHDPDQRAAFEALAGAASLQDAIDQAPSSVASLLRHLAVEEATIDTSIIDDPVSAVLAQLLRSNVRRQLAELQAELRRGEVDAAESSRQVAEAQSNLAALEDVVARSAAENALLGWLSMREERA